MAKLKLESQIRLSRPLLFILLLPVVSEAFFLGSLSPDTRKWHYNDQEHWRADHRECGRTAQSPIDIQRRNVIQNSQLKLQFYNYHQQVKFKIENGHHSIKMAPITSSRDMLQLAHEVSGQHEAAAAHRETSLPSRLAAAINSLTWKQEHNQSSSSSSQSDSSASTSLADLEEEPDFETGFMANKESVDGDPFLKSATFGRAKPPINNNQLDGHENDRNQQQQQNSQQRPLKFNGLPGIKLDWMDQGNDEFTLRDIHFHWGERKDNGSEHAIDGRRSAMEMHLVHVKNGLSLSQISYESDSVVVLAILIESYRKSNADFNPIVNALGQINATKNVELIEYKSLSDLLPDNLEHFYTYSGSLTTPPCFQVVNWIVMTDRLYLNAKQIEMFRNLYAPPSSPSSKLSTSQAASFADDHEHEQDRERDRDRQDDARHLESMTPNVRNLQPLNDRTIWASFSPSGRIEDQPDGPGNGAKARASAASWKATACSGLLIVACLYLS